MIPDSQNQITLIAQAAHAVHEVDQQVTDADVLLNNPASNMIAQ